MFPVRVPVSVCVPVSDRVRPMLWWREREREENRRERGMSSHKIRGYCFGLFVCLLVVVVVNFQNHNDKVSIESM